MNSSTRITYRETRQDRTGKVTYTTNTETSKPWRRISRQTYHNITNDETLKFFRRLGASEHATRSYTSAGYLIVKLVSKSPSRDERVIREFRFFS